MFGILFTYCINLPNILVESFGIMVVLTHFLLSNQNNYIQFKLLSHLQSIHLVDISQKFILTEQLKPPVNKKKVRKILIHAKFFNTPYSSKILTKATNIITTYSSTPHHIIRITKKSTNTDIHSVKFTTNNYYLQIFTIRGSNNIFPTRSI